MAKEKNKTELPIVMEGELRTRLIKLREDAGYNESQMADALCLSEEVIVNLENEAFDLLAEPPYVRGYLRNYAKLGDEDASELINRYESLRGADANELNYKIKTSGTINTTAQKRMSPVIAQVIILVALLGGIALLSTIPGVNTWISEKWKGLSSKLEPSNADKNPSLLGQLPVPAPLPGDETTTLQQSENTGLNQNTQTATAEPLAINSQSTQSNNASSESTSTTNNNNSDSNAITPTTESTKNTSVSNEVINNTPEPSQVPAVSETSNETQTTNTSEDVIPSDPNGIINIKLVFNNEVWLRIKDKDNKTVFEGLNKASTDKTLDLMKPLTFRVGNAQGLSLFIDNKAVDISTYINGSIANFTLE